MEDEGSQGVKRQGSDLNPISTRRGEAEVARPGQGS
jgi:hypothetical protein